MQFLHETIPTTRHYAAQMRERNHRVYWTTRQGDTSILVCCPFKKYPFDDLDGFCTALNKLNSDFEQFTEVQFKDTSYYVKLVPFKEKEKKGGCDLFRTACSYVVLACEADGDSVIVYPPKNIKDQSKDFSYEAVLTYCDEVSYVKKGPFRKEEEVPTGFIIVDTQNLNLPDYEDGDICYMIDALEIPITRKMLSSPIYIRTRRQPVFVSKKPGLKLTTAKLND